ncbi:MAG: hypothetical protein HRF46_09920 [Acidobacteriota bacterium]
MLREVTYTPSAGSWAWRKDHVWRDGHLLASVSASEGLRHYHLDHLGSPRLLTDRCAERLASWQLWPFGLDPQGQAGGGGQHPERMRFTGHERDLHLADRASDDLDYMHARYYSPLLARFLNVDPGRDNDLRAPQSWNLYAYVRNNPVRLLDLDGRAVFESADKLREVGKAVVARPDLQPRNGQTFCNFGVQAILRAGGDHSLDGMRAAQMAKFLANPDNATEVTFAEAVALAKKGVTIVVAQTAGSGGHVAVVAPEDPEMGGSRWDHQLLPVLFNVGDKNGVDVLREFFRLDHKPKAYLLNRDKKALEAKEEKHLAKTDDERHQP